MHTGCPSALKTNVSPPPITARLEVEAETARHSMNRMSPAKICVGTSHLGVGRSCEQRGESPQDAGLAAPPPAALGGGDEHRQRRVIGDDSSRSPLSMRSRGAQNLLAEVGHCRLPGCPWAHDGQRGRFSGVWSRLTDSTRRDLVRAWASDLKQCSHAESGKSEASWWHQNEGAVPATLDELVDPPDAEQRRPAGVDANRAASLTIRVPVDDQGGDHGEHMAADGTVPARRWGRWPRSLACGSVRHGVEQSMRPNSQLCLDAIGGCQPALPIVREHLVASSARHGRTSASGWCELSSK